MSTTQSYLAAKQAAEQSGLDRSLLSLVGQIERIREFRRQVSASRLQSLEQQTILPRWWQDSTPGSRADMLVRINKERDVQGLPPMQSLEDPRPAQALTLLRGYAEAIQTSRSPDALIELDLDEMQALFGNRFMSKLNLDVFDTEQRVGQARMEGAEEDGKPPADTEIKAPALPEGERRPDTQEAEAHARAAAAAGVEVPPEAEAPLVQEPVVAPWRERAKQYLQSFAAKKLTLAEEVSLYNVKMGQLPELWTDPDLTPDRKAKYLDHLVSEAKRLNLPLTREVLETFAEAGEDLRKRQLDQLGRVATIVNSGVITPDAGDELLRWLGLLPGPLTEAAAVGEGRFFQAEPVELDVSDVTSLSNAIGSAYKVGMSDLDTYPMRQLLWSQMYGPDQAMPAGWMTTTYERARGEGVGGGAGDLETNQLLIRDQALAKEASDLASELAGKPRFPTDTTGKPTPERAAQIQTRLNEIRRERQRLDQILTQTGFRADPWAPSRDNPPPEGVSHDPQVAYIVLQYAADPRISGTETVTWLKQAGASRAEIDYYMNGYFWGRHFRPQPGAHRFEQAESQELPGVRLPTPGSEEAGQVGRQQQQARGRPRGQRRRPGQRRVAERALGGWWGPPPPPEEE